MTVRALPEVEGGGRRGNSALAALFPGPASWPIPRCAASGSEPGALDALCARRVLRRSKVGIREIG
jgi:hypothetical protein